MARIPQITAQRSLNPGGPVSYPGSLPTGQALAGLGGTLAAVGERMQQRQDQLDSFKARVAYEGFNAGLNEDFTKAQESIPADGQGFHDSFAGQVTPEGQVVKPGAFDNRAQQFIQSLPASQRAKYEQLIPVQRQEWSTRAARQQHVAEQTYYRTQTASGLDRLAVGISQSDPNDPQTFARFREEGEGLIRDSGLEPAEKELRIQKWRQESAEASFKALVARDPAAARRALGIPEVVQTGGTGPGVGGPVGFVIETAARKHGEDGETLRRIAQLESGGRPNAKNPGSSAGGLFQFIDGTAKAYGLSNRYDAAQASDAAARLLKDNRQALRSALGREPTGGELYLAHQQGSGGAIKLLSNPMARAVDVVGKDAIRLNVPKAYQAENLTSQDFANIWIQKYEGTAGSPPLTQVQYAQDGKDMADPRFQDIPYDRRLALGQDAAVAETRQAAAVEQQRKSFIDSSINDLQNRIIDGQAGFAEIEAGREAGWLTDADQVTKMRGLVEKSQGDAMAVQSVLAGAQLNPYSTDDKKTADAALSGLTAGGMEPLQAVETIYSNSNIVPPAAVQQLRGGLISQNPGTAETAMQLASNILVRNPNAFAGYDGGADIAKQAYAFQGMVERGMAPDQAARRVVEINSPEYASRVKVGDAEVNEFRKTIKADTIEDVFDLGTWNPLRSGAQVGIDRNQQNAIIADFTAAAEERYRETGDADIAKDYAKKQLSAVYGTSKMAGGDVFMKFPPEKRYPALRGPDGTQSHQYIYEQAAGAVQEYAGVEVKESDIVLTHIPGVTSRDWNRSEPPRYRLAYFKEENGQRVLEVIHDQAFTADPALAQAAYAVGEPARQQEFEQRGEARRQFREEIGGIGSLPGVGEIGGVVEMSPLRGVGPAIEQGIQNLRENVRGNR